MAKKIMDKDYNELGTVDEKGIEPGTSIIKFPDGQSIVTNIPQLGGQVADGGWFIPFGSVAAVALLHGVNQKIGDSASGAKGDPEKAYESCLTTREQLITGEWNKAREGGGEGTRPSLVVEAVLRVKKEAGMEVDIAATTAKYTGKGAEETRKQALANPKVKAAYEAIRLEAQQKRAQEAAAKAGDADVTTL